MKVKCPRCGHEWDYKGQAWWITCPRCRKLFKNVGVIKDAGKEYV